MPSDVMRYFHQELKELTLFCSLSVQPAFKGQCEGSVTEGLIVLCFSGGLRRRENL